MGFFSGLTEGAVAGVLKGIFAPITAITDKIVQLKIEREKAATDQEKIHADERIKALENRRDVLIAESSTPINQIVRAGLALPPMIYLFKIFVWDKVIGSLFGHSCHPECSVFNTDALDPNLWKVVAAVYGFYFMYDIGTKAITALRGR